MNFRSWCLQNCTSRFATGSVTLRFDGILSVSFLYSIGIAYGIQEKRSRAADTNQIFSGVEVSGILCKSYTGIRSYLLNSRHDSFQSNAKQPVPTVRSCARARAIDPSGKKEVAASPSEVAASSRVGQQAARLLRGLLDVEVRPVPIKITK